MYHVCTILLLWCLFIIQEDGATALIMAAHEGHEQVVGVLMKAGANPDIQDKVTECVRAY